MLPSSNGNFHPHSPQELYMYFSMMLFVYCVICCFLYGDKSVSSSNLQGGRPPLLVVRNSLFNIIYMHLRSTSGGRLFHLQPYRAPCRGDWRTLIMTHTYQ